MDDRPKDDEDGDPHHLRRSRKLSSVSSATVTAAAPTKRSSARKLSLDGMSDSADLSSSARSLSYPNHHLHSSPPPSSYSQHHYHHHSVDFVNPNPNPNLNPNLPHPLPPPNQSLTLPSSAASLLPRRFFVSEGSAPNNTLDRAMSEFGGAPGTLPEFMGAGGGTGIFRVPVRAAMHPARPPALELRPHPLRETQFGAFLRTVDCTDKQLWAGQESGVRFWSLSEVYEGWGDCGNAGSVKKGDEDSAPFRVSAKTSPTLCLAVDVASGLVWSGHKDGRVKSWVIESEEKAVVVRQSLLLDLEEEDGFRFREGLSWQAHRTPVLSMVISAYGKFYYQNVFFCTWLLTIYACVKW